MLWIVVGAVFVGAAFLTFLWLFAATWSTLFRSFAPSRYNDGAVFQAQHSTSHG
jgi:hypothetical protein